MESISKRRKLPPQIIILLSFLSIILIGAVLFCLPISTVEGHRMNFLQAIYLSTSATCVTGLTTVSPGDSLTLFGCIVLAILIEIGGLSFLTIMTFFFSLFSKKFQVKNTSIMKEYLGQEKLGQVKSTVRKIVIIALIIQAIGALLIFLIYHFKYSDIIPSLRNQILYAAFHSISAFNNSGIDIFYDLGASSLIPFENDWMFLSVTMFLIIFGGLGFILIQEVFHKRKWSRFSLQTKLVLITTLILIVGGSGLYYLFFKLEEYDISYLNCLFLSVTTRTAGFTSIDLSIVSNVPAAHVLSIVLMFIGASPCSTGGGFKTTSVAILIISTIAYARNRTPVVFKRRLPPEVIHRTLVLFTIQILYILLISTTITLIEYSCNTGIGYHESLFEVVSAFETVGLSEAGSANFTIASQILIILTMFFGRLGPLTLLSLWNDPNSRIKEASVQYVTENVVIG